MLLTLEENFTGKAIVEDTRELRLHPKHVLYPVYPVKGVLLWIVCAQYFGWPDWLLATCLAFEVTMLVGWVVQYRKSRLLDLVSFKEN